jgi:hypothetical protein
MSSKSKKSKLGQFFTTNFKYILQNLNIPQEIHHIIEPFAGNGDLLNFIENKDKYTIECYDIEPKKDFIIQRDTLLNPLNYNNKFIITNPPYLARNKSQDKFIFDKYKTNDLYKCFIQSIINNNCNSGILIIPLNFFSSIRKSDIDLRRHFFKIYDIITLNIFEEKVFEDTSYSICSFQFILKLNCNNITNICIYPSKKYLTINLSNNNYIIGGEIYMLKQNNNYIIERATFNNKTNEYLTNIAVKCIDDNINNQICLFLVDDNEKSKYIDNSPNLTARSYAILIITPNNSKVNKLTILDQQILVEKFNNFLNAYRDKYNSLFLTNYRESNSIARKRISFKLVYDMCNFLL